MAHPTRRQTPSGVATRQARTRSAVSTRQPPAASAVPTHQAQTASAVSTPVPSGGSWLMRLLWMGAGNLLLAAFALVILQRGGFSAFDVLYWGTVLGMAAVRYVDIVRFGGDTADGRPATMRDYRKYVLVLGVVSVVVWAASHAVGPRL